MNSNQYIQPDQFLTPKEASTCIGVTVGTLVNWRVRGIGPNYRKLSANGRVRYPASAVRSYCESRKLYVSSVEKNVKEAYVAK